MLDLSGGNPVVDGLAIAAKLDNPAFAKPRKLLEKNGRLAHPRLSASSDTVRLGLESSG